MQFYFQSECNPNINSSAPKKAIVVNYADPAAREKIRQLCLRKARQIQNSNLDLEEATEFDQLGDEEEGECGLAMEGGGRGGADEEEEEEEEEGEEESISLNDYDVIAFD